MERVTIFMCRLRSDGGCLLQGREAGVRTQLTTVRAIPFWLLHCSNQNGIVQTQIPPSDFCRTSTHAVHLSPVKDGGG
jgi:hypothetical protein